MTPSDPQFIAAVGLPSVGKSRVFQELGRLKDARVFLEPEEPEWPDAVTQREDAGYFTALTWFRAARVPFYFQAAAARAAGQTALLDSYYDKLCGEWLGRPGMEWLLDPGDPYFGAAQEVARLDRALLPLADILVVFTVEEPVWKTFIEKRGRDLDRAAALQETFPTQRYFLDAAESLAGETGIRLIRFHQDRVDSPRAAAERLANLL